MINTLSSEDVVLSSEAITTPMWSNGSSTIGPGAPNGEALVSSSVQTTGLSGDYYVDIYRAGNTSSVEFACTFADKYGSGSTSYDSQVPENTPTRTIFGQYRTLVLGDEESDFYFGGNTGSGSASSSFFWAVNIDRARYKESLMPGTLTLVMSGSGGTPDLVLVDNSTIEGSVRYLDSGRVYNIVEGTQVSGSTGYLPDTSKTTVYGYFLPDIGIMLLDGKTLLDANMIDTSGFWDGTGIISTEMTVDVMAFVNRIKTFTLQAKETVTSNYVFIRAKSKEFNYSMNPTYITSTGELRHKVMANSPETYITTVGLYNNNNDLVAVAKLSRPLPKNFTKEALFRIKLDY